MSQDKDQLRELTPEVIANLTMGNVMQAKSLQDVFLNLQGKVAIVTGGASGLGYNVVNRLSEAGAKVVIASRNEVKGRKAEAEFRSRGRDVSWYPTDVSVVADCGKVVEFTEKTYGPVDILVANAATWNMFSYVDMPEKEFDRVLGVDLKGEYFMGQAAARSMIRHGVKGKIVFISSGARHSCDAARIGMMTHYNAAKGGIVSMTMGVAKELRQYGINVNCVAPGGMLSEGAILNNNISYGYYGMELAGTMSQCGADTPMTMNPDEVALVVFAMCTDMANYMYGETVDVTGGVTLSYQEKPWSYTLEGGIPGPKAQ